MDVRLRGKIGPRTPTPGPIHFRLRLFKLSRLLRCVYPALLSGLERIWPPHTHPWPNLFSPPADRILSLASLRSRGFEPPRVAPLEPESSASASFATSASQNHAPFSPPFQAFSPPLIRPISHGQQCLKSRPFLLLRHHFHCNSLKPCLPHEPA